MKYLTFFINSTFKIINTMLSYMVIDTTSCSYLTTATNNVAGLSRNEKHYGGRPCHIE
ncbi:MAG TPA: hypothetical protein GXZ90_00760 [Clostridiales bacterium]|nr:hypothetical protein [Clostridiales bacterium]